MDFKTLTNVRPTREKGTHLITNTTKGSMKLTPKAAAIVGIGDGDYLGIVTAGQNEDGSPQVGIFEGTEDLGAKLASTKKGGRGDMQFSSAMTFDTLGGNNETKRYFSVSETPLDSAELEGTPYEGKDIYMLTFEKEEQKAKRKASSDSDKETSTSSEEVESAQPAEAVASGDSDFDNNDFSDL